MRKKRSLLDIKCPKCRKTPEVLEEFGTIKHGSFFINNGKIDWHSLTPDTFCPTEVFAKCSCSHRWKLKGVSSMSDIKEDDEYDYSQNN